MTFKILALGGGGTKGVLHIGALRYLEEKYGNLQEKFSGGFYGCSVGSVFAIGLAFGLTTDAMCRMVTMFSSFSEILVNKKSLSDLKNSVNKKGLFDLTVLEEFFAEMFNSEGINLRNKKISDSPYPLYICASNITKHVITVFKGDVPILSAAGASCCIPIIFCPKIINTNAYIDGGYFTNVIMNFIPAENRESTLSISIAHDNPRLTPSNLVKISSIKYLYALYVVSCLYEEKMNKLSNNIELNHNLPSGISDVGETERKEMISRGYELTSSFFAKCSL